MVDGVQIIQQFITFTKRNKEWHYNNVMRKLFSIIQMLKTITNPKDESITIYNKSRKLLRSKAHISINLNWQRFINMVKSNKLAITIPKNRKEMMFRENAEKCFRDDNKISPVYGALNWDSKKGGAPSYSVDLWLKVKKNVMKDYSTFTARDSYTILLPFLESFNLITSKQMLYKEIFDWKGIIDFCLDRFWTIQNYDTTEYIEAQIWKTVTLDDIDTIYVLNIRKEKLVEELNIIIKDINRLNDIINKIKTFNLSN